MNLFNDCIIFQMLSSELRVYYDLKTSLIRLTEKMIKYEKKFKYFLQKS